MSVKPESFQRTTRTQKAVEILSRAKPGQTISYDALTKSIGVDARTSGKHIIWSARRILLAEKGMVFFAVPTVGMRLMFPGEVVRKGSHRRRKIRNQTRYCLTEYSTIEDQIAGLAEEARAEYLGNRALMQALRDESSFMAAQRARQCAMSQQSPAPPADMGAFEGS